MKRIVPSLFFVVTVTAWAADEMDTEAGKKGSNDTMQNSVQSLSEDINNDTETSQSADSKRFEPLKKGLEETPLDVRDQQDFPNNI